ncbi:unnamed protein product [Arctogadus glacialis]
MTSSADQEVKQNLISTVGGEVTLPEPVKSHAVLEPGVTVASVSSESCTLLCAVDQLSGGTLSWYQGEDLVDQSSTQRSLPLTVDRLGPQSSYRCVSANPAGNLTRSVDAKTSCTVQQRSGDEDEEEPIWLFRIVIPIICGVTFILFLSVIVFYVERHLQASIQQKGGVTQQEEPEHGRCNTHVRYNEIQGKENLKE